jgi:ficolin
MRSVNGWLVIQSRVDSSYPINQTWAVYRDGFGDIMSNFWLGLEKIHQLTTRDTYQIRFEVQAESDGT